MEFNYKVIVSYDGKNYHGWAKQPNHVTIQEVIENTLSKIFDSKIRINGSGRTDAFVHANNQVFNFKAKKKFASVQLLKSLNEMLPNDIVVKDIENVNNKFHAQFNVILKEYVYWISLDKNNVFYNDYALFHNKKINIKKIKEASKLLIGRHDFLSFSISENENTVREIKTIKTIKKNNFIIISVVGTGFLRGMVRMIVGTLLDYSDGKKTINDIKKLLLNPKKGSAITKVKACGLYLNKVKY